MVCCSYSATVIGSSDFSDCHEILTNNWPNVSKTSTLTLLKKEMLDGVMKPVNRIRRMNSPPLVKSM